MKIQTNNNILRGEPMAFSPICRKSKRPAEASKRLQQMGVQDIVSENRLEVRAAANDVTEIVLLGTVGSSWWDESGIKEKEVREAIASVPKGRKILLRINSEGGSVKEGLGIYNAIAARKEDIQVRIEGYALSIASVFPLAAKKNMGGRGVISPTSALWMQHKAWTWAQGNAADMRQTADMLDAHDETLVDIYVKATGKSREEIEAIMEAETWTRGSEAVAAGLADETDEDESDDSKASYRPLHPDYIGACKNAPEILNTISASRACGGGAQPNEEETMNRKQKLALLASWGVKIKDESSVTDERLDDLIAMGKEGALAAVSYPAPKAESQPQPKASTTTVPAAADPNAIADQVMHQVDCKNELRQMVNDGLISEEMMNFWLPKVVEDRTGKTLTNLKASLANRPMPAEPVNDLGTVEFVDASPTDLANGILNLRKPVESFLRGNPIDDKDRNVIVANSKRMMELVTKNRDRLNAVLNTNTISSDLKRVVILADGLREFKRRILALRAFSTVFNSVPLKREGGLNKVAVPFYPLKTTASNNFSDGTGYEFDHNTTISSLDVTINKRKYQPFNFYSHELARQPFFNVERLIGMNTEQLGVDVVNDVLSVVTNANFGAPVKSEPAEAFDSDDVIDIGTQCNIGNWPAVGRSLILNSLYYGNLKKDPSLKHANQSGTDRTLREGVVGRIDQFDIYEVPSLPDNSENLVGMAVFPSAILVATAPIEPGPGVRRQLISYDLVIDPDTGAAFEYRYWGNPDKDEEREVVECNYGYKQGQTAALKRITSQ